jgi:hypothetical protein
MAEYKGIKGFKVQTVSTDPAASAIAGGTWASGGDLNTGGSGGTSSGTQTSALYVGGRSSPFALNESYDGTSWSELTDLTTGRVFAFGFGASNTSALTSGGYTGPTGPFFINTETWNGTSWTEVNDLNTGRGDGASFGLTSAGIAAGGFYGPPPVVAGLVESWDGTSWSEVNDLNTARYYARGIGISTSGLVVGGTLPGFSALNESWNGTSWTEVGDLNTARERAGGSGISTSGLIFGGNTPPVSALTEFYDGTSWTEVNDLSTARLGQGGTPSGTSSLALSVGGYTTTNVAVTEEWTAPSVFQQENLGQVFYNSTSDAFKVTRIVTGTGAWASGGTLNTGRQYMGAAGISDTSALIFSGTSPATGVTESYDGSTWTEVNDMSTGRGYLGGGAGTQTAAIAVGGSSPTNPATSGTTEIWDGTSWTTVSSLTRGAVAPQSTVYGSTTGITTSALYIGGGEGTGTDTLTLTEAYNGTSWAEVGDLTTAVSYGAGIGKSDTDALLVTGINWAPGSAINSETNMYYNGTSWTELANVNTARAFLGGGTYGSSTDALIFGGRNQGPSAVYAITESWNGTSWTEVADLGTARMTQGGSGTSASAIYAGGSPYLTITEEWLQPSSTQNQTLTAS